MRSDLSYTEGRGGYTEGSWLLHQEKVAVKRIVPERMLAELPMGLQHPEVKIIQDEFGDMILALSAYVLTEHLADDTVTVKRQVPRTWWDHAKQDLEVWARDQRSWLRRPIRWWYRHHWARTKTIELTATWTRKASRPESRIVARDLGTQVYQESVSHEIEEY